MEGGNTHGHVPEGYFALSLEDLGIESDDILRCVDCRKYLRVLVEDIEPPFAEDDLCHCGD